jgi:hypothetical protein
MASHAEFVGGPLDGWMRPNRSTEQPAAIRFENLEEVGDALESRRDAVYDLGDDGRHHHRALLRSGE